MIRPLDDWMVLELDEGSISKTLAVPDLFDAEKDESSCFKVISVGAGYITDFGYYMATKVKAGDKVIVTSFGMSKFKLDGKKIYLAKARDVVIVVEDDTKIQEKGGEQIVGN